MPRTPDGIEYYVRRVRAPGYRRKYELKWFPDRSSTRARYRQFHLRAEAMEYAKQGFPSPDERVAKTGRKPNSGREEMQNEPGEWPDEASEVMANVIEKRTRSGRPFNLLSDVYWVMIDMGFKRERES